VNLIKNKKIAIAGGGLGGLTLARILQMNGADVKVYERDLNKNVRMQGATLDLHEESGLKALTEAGLIDEFKANYRPGAEKLRLIDKNAKILVDEHTQKKDEIARPEIDRGPLQNILLNSLRPDTVVWNSQFVLLTPHNDSWKLKFKNGSSVIADIVIGADGANSKIRPYITPIKSFYTGVTAVEGVVYNSENKSPRMHALLKGGKIFTIGDEKSLILSSKGDGSLVFYPSFKAEENWHKQCGINFNDKAEVLAWFKKEYTGWNTVWQELFENADSHFVLRPIYSMPFDQTWEALPNLTIIGDAAHLMSPFAGEGVNMAMLDALELGKNLSSQNFPDIKTAIATYEKQMRERASATGQDSLGAQTVMHSENAMSFLMEMFGGAHN
jgi:2-polyprenyl-6-methoxyphenol hydroxylase-like FAD-dependent oxidoreductase